MKQNDFDRLVASVKQAGAIRRGQLKPGRVTELQAEDVRAGPDPRTRRKGGADAVRR